MSTVLRTILACSLILGASAATAADAPPKCRYRPVAKLDLQYHGAGLELTMPGEINGTPAIMLIDTGATRTALTRFGTDKRAMRRLPSTAYATGVGGSTRLYDVQIRSFQVGPIKSDDRGYLRAIDETGRRSEVDAIVGSEFLLQMDMELSLAEKTIKFFAPQNCDNTFLGYWDHNAVEVPLLFERERSRPGMEIELNGVKLRALIDTGATHSSVRAAAARRAGVNLDSEGVTRTGVTSGIGAKVMATYSATFKTFSVGDELIKNPVLDIVDHESDQYDVVLGTDFLRAHRLLFAVEQRKIYLSYIGGSPFRTGQLEPWIEQEAQAGNSYAQYRLGRAGAPEWMDKALAQDNPLALRAVATARGAQGRFADSVALYEKLLRQDPHDMSAQLELFAMRLRAGQADQARPHLEKAMTNFRWPPWPAPIVDYYLGKITLEDLFKEARSDKDTARRRQCEVLRHAHALQIALKQDEPAAALAARAKAECGATPPTT